MTKQERIKQIRDELKHTHDALRDAQHENDKRVLRETSKALNLALARVAMGE